MAYSKNRRLAEIISDTSGNLSVQGIVVPTQSASDNDTSAASTAFVHTHIDALVDSAPGTMNTLNEIAAALNDDAAFNTTVTNAIATKAPLASPNLTGSVTISATGTNAAPHIKLAESGDGREFNIFNDGSGNGRLVLADSADDTPDTEIVLADNGVIQFKTANTNRVTIAANGRMALGNNEGTSANNLTLHDSSSAELDLDCSGGKNFRWQSTNASALQLVDKDASNAIRFAVASSGNTGIGVSDNLDRAFTIGTGAAKTSTSTTYPFAIQTSESSNAGRLSVHYTGAANAADRQVFFQMEEEGVANSGNIIFNPYGGKVGVGSATAPSHKLDVTGTIRTYASGSGNAWLYTQNDNKTYLVGVRGSSSNAFSIYDLTADKSRFRVNSDGGVAIGEDNTGYSGQILSIKSGTGNNVLYGESSDANCIMSVRDSGSSNNIGYGCISNAHVFFQDGTEIARFSTGSSDKYSYSSAGLGGSGTNLHIHGDDGEIKMANNIIHSDNSGNTKFTIRTGYGVTSDLAELSLDGGFVSMNVGTSFTEMLKATTSRVTIGRTNSYGYYLRVQTSTGLGEQGSHNSSYYHHSTDRGIFYFGTRCEASGGFHTYSDENLKKEITVINGALDSVAKMNGVTFKWKDPKNRGGGDEGKQFGVIAQNMLEVDSELPSLNDDPLSPEETRETDDSFYTMDYTRLTPYFIEAIKELKAKNEALEERIKTLEG